MAWQGLSGDTGLLLGAHEMENNGHQAEGAGEQRRSGQRVPLFEWGATIMRTRGHPVLLRAPEMVKGKLGWTALS